ncbi:hypothetical protein JXQ70_18685 [bacterium]|nr:hypothetical protein [bacterium]
MKKDLDQLIAEYKRQEARATLSPDGTPTELFQEMTWSERGQRLLKLIEDRNGSIGLKELLFDEIEQLGINNTEEGRAYLRNFLSLFVQQKLLIKTKMNNKTFYLINKQFSSANIQEYFDLLSGPQNRPESYQEIQLKKYQKRVQLLVNILRQKGPLPVPRFIEEHLVEFGFTNDTTGRREVQLFLRRAIRKGAVRTFKKDSIPWLGMPELQNEGEQSCQISHQTTPVLMGEVPNDRQRSLPSRIGSDRGPALASIRTATFSLDLKLFAYQSLFELDGQLNELDEHLIGIVDQLTFKRRQLWGLNQVIDQLTACRTDSA